MQTPNTIPLVDAAAVTEIIKTKNRTMDAAVADARSDHRMNMNANTRDSSRSASTDTERRGNALMMTRQGLDLTLGCRTAGRHKVEMYLHSLHRLQVQEERLDSLVTVTGGEVNIVRQIADFEQQMLRLESFSMSLFSNSNSSGSGSRRNNNTNNTEILDRIRSAAETADIPSIVQEMMNPIQGVYWSAVQELGIRALLSLTGVGSQVDIGSSHQANKLHVVNCSGIKAVVAAMRNHKHDAALQRQGAALLLNLPFFTNVIGNTNAKTNADHGSGSGSDINMSMNITRLCDDASSSTFSCLDLHVVQLLVQEGALHCILEATEENLLQVVMDPAGDESGNYVRSFAKLQIPALCQLLMDLYGYDQYKNNCDTSIHTESTIGSVGNNVGVVSRQQRQQQRHEQNQKVGQALSFIRRSLASLTDDPSIAPDNLVSFLQNKRMRTDYFNCWSTRVLS
jgi:hypothetical protein